MKKILLLVVYCLFLVIGSFAQQDSLTALTNPYWLQTYFGSKNYHYLSTGMIEIGEGGYKYEGGIFHTKKTISVTLPIGASIKSIHPFFFNTGCLGGGSATTTPWGTTPNIDYRWGTFYTPVTSVDSEGRQVVSVEYDNHSDCDARAGFLIVRWE